MRAEVCEYVDCYFEQFELVLVQIDEHVEGLDHSHLQIAEPQVNDLFGAFLGQGEIPERSK